MLTVPQSERPRERLLKEGVDALSLSELLAILLCTGTKEKSVLLLAQEVVARFGSVKHLLEASIEELTEIKGIGQAKGIQLKAAFGIALKSLKSEAISPIIDTPHDAFKMVRSAFIGKKQEILCVLLRDGKKRLIHVEQVGVGTLSEVLVHPREVFFPAVKHKASSLILVHNHPSGDLTPSKADLKVTHLLQQCAAVMGIDFSDHLIVAEDRYLSIKEYLEHVS